MSTHVLLFEGNIAAGKTTLIQRSVKRSAGQSMMLKEKINNELISLFYNDRARYAFAFQLHMLESRTNGNMVQLLESGNNHNSVWLDRSIFGDFVFAVANYITGAITEAEMKVYCSTAGAHTFDDVSMMLNNTYGNYPWAMIYLHSPAAECKKRADSRGSVEAGVVPLEYFELIEQVYFNAVYALKRYMPSRARVMLWKDYKNTDEAGETILRRNGFSSIPELQKYVLEAAETDLAPEGIDQSRMEQLGMQWFSGEFRERKMDEWAN